jgi:hypothetical protein
VKIFKVSPNQPPVVLPGEVVSNVSANLSTRKHVMCWTLFLGNITHDAVTYIKSTPWGRQSQPCTLSTLWNVKAEPCMDMEFKHNRLTLRTKHKHERKNCSSYKCTYSFSKFTKGVFNVQGVWSFEGTLPVVHWRHVTRGPLKARYPWSSEGTLPVVLWRHVTRGPLKARYPWSSEGTVPVVLWRHVTRGPRTCLPYYNMTTPD